MTNNINEFKTWIKTDDTQWVYQQNTTEFWVIQIRLWGYDYCVTINFIDLETYDIEDIIETMETFGYESIEELPGRDVAECLAEEIDDFHAEFKGGMEECIRWAEWYMQGHDGSNIFV